MTENSPSNVPAPADSPRDAAKPLTDLLGTYGQCLALGRGYADAALNSGPDDDRLDLDHLEHFLTARAELITEAERSLAVLARCPASEDPVRRDLTGQVRAVLEEMTRLEGQLSDFLGRRLNSMRETIGQMKRTQMVFKRYSQVGEKLRPYLFTHRE